MVALSCVTYNKNNHLLAFGLGESENSELLNGLILLCLQAGVDLDNPDVTFVSDRSKAILKSVRESAPLANHLHCAKHLERNLTAEGIRADLMWLFWKAR